MSQGYWLTGRHEPSSPLPSTLIEQPIKEGIDDSERDVPHRDSRWDILEKPFLDEIQETAVVAIILVHVLRLVELIFLIEVVFWRVIFVLIEKPQYVCPAISLDIRINISQISIRVTLLILGVEAALDIRLITV
ncbi:MAG: hypothetical protein M1839_005789, partial [Geoglossum umbratile]